MNLRYPRRNIPTSLYRFLLRTIRSHYSIVAIVILLVTLPSILLGNTPFYHVDFVNEYASYIAHGDYMVRIKNPLSFWWLFSPLKLDWIPALLAVVLKQFISDTFSLFVLLTKVNFLVQTIVAAFTMLLLTRELFGRSNILNIVSALVYALTPYYLSETTIYSARMWIYSLAPLTLWITYKYYRIASQKIPSWKRIYYVAIGGIVFSLSYYPVDKVIIVLLPSLLLSTVLFIHVLVIEKNRRRALSYLAYIALGLIISLIMSLEFIITAHYAYTAGYSFKVTRGVSGYIESYMIKNVPNFLEALQGINMEHKHHFTHIIPFREFIEYPSLTYVLVLVFLLGLALALSSKVRFTNCEDKVRILTFYIVVLIGLVMVGISTNRGLFEMLRSSIPYAYYLRRPHRLLIFWNLAISLVPAFLSYLVTKLSFHDMKSSSNTNGANDVLKAVLSLTMMVCMFIYMFGAVLWAYTPPYSILANYEPIYSASMGLWRKDVVRSVWDSLNMSNTLHRNLVSMYTVGPHAFIRTYPGFTDSQDMLMWTKYYIHSPSYEDILMLYGIKYVIARKGLSRTIPLPLYKEHDGIEIKQIQRGAERIYIGNPLLVVGGPNALSTIPILVKSVERELFHILTNDTPTLVPVFADSLLSGKLEIVMSKINVLVLHNSDLLDMVALRSINDGLAKPIANTRNLAEIYEVLDAGWEFFEPKYYGYIAPSGMHNSVYGQTTYGDYALIASNTSRSLKTDITIESDGEYVLMFRVGRFSPNNDIPELRVTVKHGNEIVLNTSIRIRWLGFKWIFLNLGSLRKGDHDIILTPRGNIFVDNIIVVLTKQRLNEYYEWALHVLESKHVVYIYEPSSYTDNHAGYLDIVSVKYGATDPSLGALLIRNNSRIEAKFHVIKGDYLLFIRYKGTDPQVINTTVTVNNKEIPLTEVASSIDEYDWLYNLYSLRVNGTSDINTLVIKIGSTRKDIIVDFLSLISIDALRDIYSIPREYQVSPSIEVKINKFIVMFHGVKWSHNGIYFDGVDDCIEIKNLTCQTLSNKFTVLVFLKVEGSPPQVFIAKHNPPHREWQLGWYIEDKKIKGWIWTKRYVWCDSDSGPLMDRYALYGLMYNGTHLSVIVEGNLSNQVKVDGTLQSTEAPITVGCRGDRKVFTRGYVLSVLVYNRTLDIQELRQISRDPFNPPREGLILHLEPYTVKPIFDNTSSAKPYTRSVEWYYELNRDGIASGKIICSKPPCALVFVWPVRKPNEFAMIINGETMLPVKTLYALHGYIIEYEGIQNFEILYNTSRIEILARVISLSSWLIVSVYIIMVMLIIRLKRKFRPG